MDAPVIERDGVRLRPYRDDDLTDMVAACNDPLTRRFLDALPSPYTEADGRWWLTEGAPATWARGGAAYAVADPESDRLLGTVGVDRLVPMRGQAEIGYWVAPWARRRGVATAATRALTAHALASGLSRLELFTHPENAASQRVALAAGYRHEGVRRAVSPQRGGGRCDSIAWVRLADDPPGPVPRLLPDLPPGGLTDGVIALRPVGPDDVDLMYRLHTLPEVVANRVPPEPPTRAEIERRCRTAESSWLVGTAADLVVVDVTSGEAGGGLALRYDEPRTGQAMLGASMLPAWRGRGLLTRGVRLLVGWAFDTVGVARLWAGCRPENVAPQRVLEKVGFRREGIQRGRLPGPDGTRVDSLLYALLPTDRP
ncbi:Protein N-acetyltransferase, RimJ/RimL family [Micromonospora pallida]|uniref:Protein N-acetyltransferase, RimJ/RimL family n=1 Tax=Micromonospora pallida TaxID=145854 RepID=A0A1C6T0P7_9ACTN|nr:GNAT family N-acetyltransferase [Micromonospora pallida]SCL35291.1 Protein N-acetyltransferase, RimJ/RimL family [Micromonospora pallida]